ncbi:hypothetical protein AAFF_G00135770 [Aldrovandia affinis]|uniref:Uncharacterized protein n=1 Tax=Aldrovandia affinis TaxID=143900 RepID=A0AAD7RSI2_9TELE|nr:hypothetical protein AAFF_G00135770 [Aldrovandia affinis]
MTECFKEQHSIVAGHSFSENYDSELQGCFCLAILKASFKESRQLPLRGTRASSAVEQDRRARTSRTSPSPHSSPMPGRGGGSSDQNVTGARQVPHGFTWFRSARFYPVPRPLSRFALRPFGSFGTASSSA